MTPQDLADRLEKAYRLGDSMVAITIAHHYGKRVPSEDYKTLIASLRRSAPASGEMRAERVACLRCGGSGVLYYKDTAAEAGLAACHCRECEGTGRVARTPSGETREEKS